jgi:hypothetical protein
MEVPNQTFDACRIDRRGSLEGGKGEADYRIRVIERISPCAVVGRFLELTASEAAVGVPDACAA